MISIPPNAHRILLDYLPTITLVPATALRLDGEDAPAEYTRVIATGGPGRQQRHLMTLQFTVDSYALTPGRAAEIAFLADGAIHALPAAHLSIGAVPWSTSPLDYPDPDTESARYSATYQLTLICLRRHTP